MFIKYTEQQAAGMIAEYIDNKSNPDQKIPPKTLKIINKASRIFNGASYLGRQLKDIESGEIVIFNKDEDSPKKVIEKFMDKTDPISLNDPSLIYFVALYKEDNPSLDLNFHRWGSKGSDVGNNNVKKTNDLVCQMVLANELPKFMLSELNEQQRDQQITATNTKKVIENHSGKWQLETRTRKNKWQTIQDATTGKTHIEQRITTEATKPLNNIVNFKRENEHSKTLNNDNKDLIAIASHRYHGGEY